MAMKLRPLGDRVVVKPLPREEVTKSGIVLPDTAKEKPQEGEIIAAGPGRLEDGKRQALDVKVGDKVLYAKYAGTEFKLEEDELLILSEKDMLGVLESGKKNPSGPVPALLGLVGGRLAPSRSAIPAMEDCSACCRLISDAPARRGRRRARRIDVHPTD